MEEGPISQKLSKKFYIKSAILEVEKPLEMDPDICKNFENNQNSHFLRGKNPEMWVGVQTSGSPPGQKIIQVPSLGDILQKTNQVQNFFV